MSLSPSDWVINRRGFLASTVGLAAAAVAPGLRPRQDVAVRPEPNCDRLAAITQHWNSVRPMLASRYHRLHHCMFHYVRNNWAKLTPQQQDEIRALGWASPRPSMERGNWDRSKPWVTLFWETTNGSGEDFLFFHRWMIAMVDAALTQAGAGPLEAWSGTDTVPPPEGGCPDETIPHFSPSFANPGDPLRPVNVRWLQERVREMKGPSFFWSKMNWWQQEYRDRGALREVSLGELGSRLESGIHNQMHIRWSAYPTNGMQLIRDESDFRPVWDDVGYDTLFDEYSSHVGPIFYRIHKWIDNRIEDWAEANAGYVQRYTTPYGFDWFRPAAGRVQVAEPWTGAWGFQPVSEQEEARRVTIMENVTSAMFPPTSHTLRFMATQAEAEAEQARIISIRDIVM